VYGVKDRDEYWQKLGEETHQRLAVKPRYSHPVNYGAFED
jgi:glutaconate CoA-transferase subunit A